MLPKCCGKEMEIFVETSRFYEVHCNKCNDVVYVKKEEVQTPLLIDD